jgi:Tol biopolymer transport system component
VLYRGDAAVPLTPKAIELLLYLASNPGRVINKNELLRAVWPDTFVEESNLGQQIFQIRRALGQEPNGMPYIETVPKRGYRLNAPVYEAPAGIKGRRRPRASLVWKGIACAALAIAAFAAWRSRGVSRARGLELKPLTSYPGAELFPAISPDGRVIAFTWAGPNNDQIDLYARPIGGEPPLRLTEDRDIECYPAWSPEGTLIAFLHCTGNMGTIHTEAEVYVVGSSGGPKRRVGRVLLRVSENVNSLAWMPDGKHLVLPNRKQPGGPVALFSLDIDTGQMRQLTSPPANYADASPAVSHDGRTLAFVRQTVTGRGDIFLQDLSATETPAKQITHEQVRINGLAWRSARDLIYLAENGAIRMLWRAKTDGSPREPLSAIGQTGVHFSLSRDGRRLVYSDAYSDADIVRVNLAKPRWEGPLPGETIISSTRWDGSPQYSPDGQKIAFASDRSGHFEIWIADADGSNPTQLTVWNRYTGTPRWSPKGDEIAADSQEGQHTDIYVVGVNSRQTRKITAGTGSNFIPSWSRDGKWIYFVSDRRGGFQVWKTLAHSPNNAEHPVQVTKQGGFAGWESIDGKSFYYAKRSNPYCLWMVPADGGEEGEVICPVGSWIYMSMFGDGIYYAPTSRQIWFYSFVDKKPRHVFDVDKDLGSGFAISPDRRWLLFAPAEARQGDLYLIENLN